MKASNEHLTQILSLILPKEILEYFEIKDIEQTEKDVRIYLEEINITPVEFDGQKLTSKGFHNESIVQDFPFRNKALFLHVKRRRWLIEENNKVVSRDWYLLAKGTRYSEEFASFLKGILGYIPNKF